MTEVGEAESGPSALGRRLLALRKRKRWSQRDLAQEAGVSPQYLGQIERGETPNPGAAVLDKIARALGWPNYHAMIESEALQPPPVPPPPLAAVEPVLPSGLRGQIEQLVQEQFARLAAGAAPRLPRGVAELGDNVAGLVGPGAPREMASGPLPPIFAYGAAGDPDDADDLPGIVDHRNPPPEFAAELGEDCFGVLIKGESLSGLDIHDGDVAWCKRREHAPLLETVAAVVAGEDGTKKLVVKQYRQGRGQQPGLWSAEEDKSPEPTGWAEFAIRGVAVCVEPARRAFRPKLAAPRGWTG